MRTLLRPMLRFISLPCNEKRLVLRSVYWLIAVRTGLALLPFSKVLAWVDRRSNANHARQGANSIPPEQIAWAVLAASNRLPGTRSCLTRALTAQVLLRRSGYTPELKIGVHRPEGAPLKAHAWVELDGKVILGEMNKDTFTPLPPLRGQA